MPPKMVNSKDDKGQKDKFVCTSRKNFFIRNAHVRYESINIYYAHCHLKKGHISRSKGFFEISKSHCLRVIYQVIVFTKQVKLQGQGVKIVCTTERSSHQKYQVKYQKPCSKFMSQTKIFKKQVKHQGQCHSVISVGAHEKVLSFEILI